MTESFYLSKPWVKSYDSNVPPTLEPYPNWTARDLLEETVRKAPNTPALLTSSELPLFGRKTASITYSELKTQVDALAAALQDLGLQKGDRVALLMPNCSMFVVSWFAVLSAGYVNVGINPAYP